MAINSVLGPIKVEDLGSTLIHEHLGIGWPGWELDYQDFDRKKDGVRVVKRLKEIRELGIRSIVDPCPMELGRDPLFAAEMSEKSGVQVVIATGLYNDALGIPMHFRLMDVDGIAEVYVREIEQGIGTTGIKAGIIKTASGGIHGVTPPGAGIKMSRSSVCVPPRVPARLPVRRSCVTTTNSNLSVVKRSTCSTKRKSTLIKY